MARHVVAVLMFAVAVSLLDGCTSLDPEHGPPVPACVLRTKGDITFSADGKTWLHMKNGDRVWPGSLIKTGEGSYVNLGLTDLSRAIPVEIGRSGIYFVERRQIIREYLQIRENSVVALEKSVVSAMPGAFDSKLMGRHIHLDLHAGEIVGEARHMPEGSKYEIRFPKGLVRVQEGVYVLNSTGLLDVPEGKATVWLDGNVQPLEVKSGYRFDPEGMVTDLPTNVVRREFFVFGLDDSDLDVLSHPVAERPFSLPERKF